MEKVNPKKRKTTMEKVNPKREKNPKKKKGRGKQEKEINHMDPTAQPEDPDYSPSSTIIPFPHPIPLLRGPTAAGPPDDRSLVLAFKSPQSWATAYASSVSRITRQCEEASRIACAVSASGACKPPWWRNIVGPRVSLAEREGCEVREMERCVAEAKGKCAEFARRKCREPFLDARVKKVGERELLAKRLVWLASAPKSGVNKELWMLGFRGNCPRARELFGDDVDLEELSW